MYNDQNTGSNKWDQKKEKWQQRWHDRKERHSKYGHIWSGIFLLLIGVAALVKVSVPDLPNWLFSWKTFLIALGIFIGIKHRFKGMAWAVLIILGTFFIFRDRFPEIGLRQYFWPSALIALGLYLILKPRIQNNWGDCSFDPPKNKNPFSDKEEENVASEIYPESREDVVDITAIFGGAKRNIISKNFRGGDLVSVFGGVELDLSRADINGEAVLEVTNILGGTKLILPSDWALRSEAVTIFGGMEDKRNMQGVRDNPGKVLVLKGTVILGGIEIKSF
jgi:predicted membrane protein